MPILRSTIRNSARERARRIDRVFELTAKILLVAHFLFVLSAWFSYRESLRITDITVLGTLAVSADNVKSAAEGLLARPLLWKIDRNNFILYPKRAITAAIKRSDARVKAVDIALTDRKRLTVQVSEYVPALLWCQPEQVTTATINTRGCYFADSEGHIFARAPEYSGNPFLIFATTYPAMNDGAFLDGFDILPKDNLNKVHSFLAQLRNLGLTPRIVSEVGADDFIFVTDEPWTIRWSLSGDPEKDGANLALVLEELSNDPTATQKLESIDLRFGNKVFYR